MRTIEELYHLLLKDKARYQYITEIENIIKHAYNLGLQDSLDNLVVDGNKHEYEIDKESILKLKI